MALGDLSDEELRKALKAMRRGKVSKLILKPSGRSLWIVRGRRRKYIVIPGMYCSCMDFLINVVLRRRKPYCYHILMQRIAESRMEFKEEIISEGKSLSTLMDLLMSSTP